MNRRNFLLGSLCLAFAGYLGVPGTGIASPRPTDADRILRLTRRSMQRMRLIEPPEMVEIINSQQSRYLILSLQDFAEYELGHMPGAVWLPYRDLLDPVRAETLLSKLPQDKPIILTCPNGHLSCAVALYLRQLGYTVFVQAFGMDRWNRKCAGEGAYPGDIKGPLETSITRMQLDANVQYPSEYGDLSDTELAKRTSLTQLGSEFELHIKPADFQKDPAQKLVLCLMRPEDYTKYHIPGSVNLPGEAFYAGDDLLLWLPRDRKIVLSCYVGHFSSGSCVLLRQLGYDAHTLDWGMAGWNKMPVPDIARLLEMEKAMPVESGPGPDIYSF